MLYFEER